MDKKVVNWAAINGRWQFEGEIAKYLIPLSQKRRGWDDHISR
jgi:hypothetical protein